MLTAGDKPALERIRAMGIDPKRLLEEGLHEEDPSYQRNRALEKQLTEEREKREAIEKRIKEWDEQTATLKQQQEAEQMAAARKSAEEQLLTIAKEREDHGDLRSVYGQRDRSFILSAHAAADELRELMSHTGRGPTVKEVVEYMAREARKERDAQSNPAGSAQASGNAPKVTAKQTTLGAQDASVRRASAGDFSKLSPEDQREDLVALANEMLAKPAP